MFNIKSRLRNLKLQCPYLDVCHVQNCPFTHTRFQAPKKAEILYLDSDGDDAYTSRLREGFVSFRERYRKRKLAASEESTKKARIEPEPEVQEVVISKPDGLSSKSAEMEKPGEEKEPKEVKETKEPKEVKAKKPISDAKFLVPRPATRYSAAKHEQRQKVLEVIHKQLVASFPYTDTFQLLYKRAAIFLEWRVADKASSVTYNTEIRAILRKIKEGNPDFLKKFNALPNKDTELQPKEITSKEKKETVERLESILHSESTLEENEYIMKIPEPVPFSGSRTCERCNEKFWPEKLVKGTCRHHPGKKNYNRDSLGKLYYTLSCCQKTYWMNKLDNNNNDILGCTVKDFHVFKDTDPGVLHSQSPFVTTASKGSPEAFEKYPVIGLDAEMVYTDKGFEMARVTMVDFFDTKHTIYDKLIRPLGGVLDYNTQFSGISSLEGAISFAQFRKEFFDLVDGNRTILIGHGLENDMNVMRVIHSRILDTAILYKPGMKKLSLRSLAEKYLKRTIQGGEHDSAEDSIAAIDLVKHKVGIRI